MGLWWFISRIRRSECCYVGNVCADARVSLGQFIPGRRSASDTSVSKSRSGLTYFGTWVEEVLRRSIALLADRRTYDKIWMCSIQSRNFGAPEALKVPYALTCGSDDRLERCLPPTFVKERTIQLPFALRWHLRRIRRPCDHPCGTERPTELSLSRNARPYVPLVDFSPASSCQVFVPDVLPDRYPSPITGRLSQDRFPVKSTTERLNVRGMEISISMSIRGKSTNHPPETPPPGMPYTYAYGVTQSLHTGSCGS